MGRNLRTIIGSLLVTGLILGGCVKQTGDLLSIQSGVDIAIIGGYEYYNWDNPERAKSALRRADLVLSEAEKAIALIESGDSLSSFLYLVKRNVLRQLEDRDTRNTVDLVLDLLAIPLRNYAIDSEGTKEILNKVRLLAVLEAARITIDDLKAQELS